VLTNDVIETHLRSELAVALQSVHASPDLLRELRRRQARRPQVAASVVVAGTMAVGLGTFTALRAPDRSASDDRVLDTLPLAAPSAVGVTTRTSGGKFQEGIVVAGLYRDADVPTGPGSPRDVDVAGRPGLLYEDTETGDVRLVVSLAGESPARSLVLTGRAVPTEDILRIARSAIERPLSTP
jgi:hypothetical protein